MIRRTLQDVFGFDDFKSGQRTAIETVMAGESAVTVFPTGAGKSLCYQLPALHEAGMTLVISPLLSLMKDQLEFLRSKNIPAAKLDSGMPAEAYRAALMAARQGQLKILMIAVERFKNERFRTQLKMMQVSLLVVDEAHCISEWGHNFRPDYLKIPIYQRQFGIPKVLLLTATATPRVIDDMCAKFTIPAGNVVKTGFYRPNLELRVQPRTPGQRDQALMEILQTGPRGPAIVYTTLQKTAEKVAGTLNNHDFKAEPYHAGLKSEERVAVQDRFMSGETSIVAATIAFGMGIDKADIRKVIHYDLPKSIESYSQEIGRAGRDGAPALCCVLADRSGVPVLENFVYGDTPHPAGIRHLLGIIENNPAPVLEVRPYTLSRETDIRLLPLKTLLVYLELEGLLSPKYSYFEEYPYKYLKNPEQIVGRFQGERRGFVAAIVAHSQTARTWTRPDLAAIMEHTGSTRQRILTALEYFDAQGWIELMPKSAVEVYDVVNPGFDAVRMAERLQRRFAAKEATDVGRIHGMIGMFAAGRCLARGLSAYFGETLKSPCGHCSTCRDGHPPRFAEVTHPDLNRLDYPALTRPLAEALGTPLPVHLATRFLCGISTPRLIQNRALRFAGFGELAEVPYKLVEAWVAANLSDH